MSWKQFREKLKWLDPFTYVDRFVVTRAEVLSPAKKTIVLLACLAFVAFAMLWLVPPSIGSVPLTIGIIAVLLFFYFQDRDEGLNWAIYLAFAMLFALAIFSALGFAFGTSSPMMIVVSASMEPLYHRGDIIFLQGATPGNIGGIAVETGLPSLSEKELASFAQPVYSASQNGQGLSGQKEITSIKFDSGQEIPITKNGDIVVYWSEHQNEPVVHRVVAKLKAGDGWYFLTKGDSVYNPTVDQDCGLILNGRPQKECIELYPVPLAKLQGKAFLQIPLLGCGKLWLLDDLGSLITTGKMPKGFMAGNIC
jgi:signal peptidase I